jgi:hypothetical protein
VEVNEAGAEVIVGELEGPDAVIKVALGRSVLETKEASAEIESVELASVELLVMVEVASELVVEEAIEAIEASAQSLSAVGRASQWCSSEELGDGKTALAELACLMMPFLSRSRKDSPAVCIGSHPRQ